MKKSILQLASRCKSISDEKMKIARSVYPIRGVVFTDYTVNGAVDEYMEAIDELLLPLTDKYPAIGYDLKLHKDRYHDEKVVHYIAMKSIVDCVLAILRRVS